MSLALPSPPLTLPPSLADQLWALRRRWRLVALCALLVPMLTIAVLMHQPVVYTASGILFYDPEGAAVPGDSANAPVDAVNEDALTASQSELIASLPAAAALSAQLKLGERVEFAGAARLWPLRPKPPPAPGDIAEAVRRAIGVAVLPGSRILQVSFTSTDPVIAAAAANAAMALYVAHEREAAFADLTAAQTWLEAHAVQAQAALDATELQIVAARAAAGVVQGAQASLSDETISRLSASLIEAQALLAMNQARLAAAGPGDAAAANAAIAPNLLPLRKEQADLAAQVRSLATQYGPDYPDLRTARTQQAAITAEIDDETGRELDAAQAEVAAGRAEVATLQGALAGARRESEAEDAESAPIRALEQQADASRTMLRAMTLQAQALAQDASLTRPDARILSAAAVPVSPSSPGRLVILAAAVGLGLAAGILLAALAQALDTSFRCGADIRSGLNLGCLALLPEVRSPQMAALAAPFSVFAEQLRGLRTGLGLGRGACEIVAVTAARPAEGKTTLTIALARTLAAAGLRVLAIDGDIRQPGFEPAFGLGGAPGLTDHLAGLARLESILFRDPQSELMLMPAGTQAQAALSLFLSGALPACLAALRPQFDVILLDVPPAFALAEGRVLASVADRALLCVRWGKTPRRVVLGAITLLRDAGVVIAGVALTRVDARVHGRSGHADAEMYQPRYGGYFQMKEQKEALLFVNKKFSRGRR
jgi:capsular exopolysaccharide synthesis family protein